MVITKAEPANGVHRIVVDSDIKVKMSGCNTNEIIACVYGVSMEDKEAKLSVTRFGDEIMVFVRAGKPTNSRVSGKEGSANVVGSDKESGFTLNVQIPTKVFEKIYVKSKNSNIDLKSSVHANTITADNKNGNVYISAIFKTLNIDCENGNVEVDTEACGDIKLNITNKNGNVDVIIENIGVYEVLVDSKNGTCRNNPKLKGKYTVSGYIMTRNGHTKIH